MSDARDLYHSAAAASGAKGSILRLLKRVYQIRPRWPKKPDLSGDYYEGGDVLALASNLPRSAFAWMDEGARLVQTDIEPHLEHVDVVCDAQDMSDIEPETFDYVLSTSLLEHVHEPWRVVDEAFRIVKPGGRFVVVVPWMLPTHSDGRDFFRFSVPGIASLLARSGFDVEESGSVLSGHDAFRGFLMRYSAEMLSFNSSVAYYAFEYLFTWLFWPLELLELLFKPRAKRRLYISDSMVYAVGRKKPLA